MAADNADPIPAFRPLRSQFAHALLLLACSRALAAPAPAAATAPATPAALAPAPALVPAEYFVSEDSYRDPVLSPDGKYIAVITTLPDWIGTVSTLAVIRVQDKKMISAIKMARFEVPRGHWWVSNTRLVVMKARDIGDEKPVLTGEVLAVEFDGSGQDYLYGRLRGKGADAGFGLVTGLPATPNGHFYLTEFRIKTKESALYDIDSMANTRTVLLRLPLDSVDMLLDHQGRPRFATGYTRDAKTISLKYDLATLKWEPDPTNSVALRFKPLAFNADDSAVYARMAEDGKPGYLVKQDMASGARTVVASDPVFDVGLVALSARSLEPIGAMADGGGALRYFDPGARLAQLHQRLSAQFPGSIVSLLNDADGGKKMLFHVGSGRDPGGFYLYDAASDRAELLFTELEQIDPDLMGERRPITFAARDGLVLHGFLTLPRGAGGAPRALVLLPHGGPHGIADEAAFDPYAQFLASRGYAVLQVNFRGSGGRGAQFIKAGFGQWGGKIQDDLADGVRWAIAEGVADARRVCVFGISFGAYSALMLPVREPQMFRCAIGYAGVYDLEMLLRDADKKDRQSADAVLRSYLGSDPAEHRRISPALLAEQIKLPVLLIHGTVDDVTPIAQGRAMRAALREAGNAPEYLQVGAEGHGFYLPANKLKVLQALETFLARHLAEPPP